MKAEKEKNSDIVFEIIRKIGQFSQSSKGWSKELNLVSWNGGPAKYDLRDWSPDYEHMSRGITLHKEEAKNLLELLSTEDL